MQHCSLGTSQDTALFSSTGISVASVGVAGIVGEGRSDHLGLLSQAHGQQGGEGDLVERVKVMGKLHRNEKMLRPRALTRSFIAMLVGV